MKKFVIQNLTTRSFWNKVDGFSVGLVPDIMTFDSRELAESKAEWIAERSQQQNEDNQLWNYGFVLTVLEVYV